MNDLLLIEPMIAGLLGTLGGLALGIAAGMICAQFLEDRGHDSNSACMYATGVGISLTLIVWAALTIAFTQVHLAHARAGTNPFWSIETTAPESQ